jgi:dienelactone hydrolase
LPELPAVSSSLLDLGERLEEAGYTVYIPVLWGSEWDDATQKGLTNKRAFSLSFDPRFKGLCGSADRPAVHEVARFCRYLMDGPHRGQHLGMIGNCLTGNFPIAVAAEVPELVAPILSQPAIPFFDPSHPGLTRTQITALKARTHDTAHPPLQIVGFRFAGDQVSPEPRFQTYHDFFCDSFLPYVIPTRLYVDQDQLPLHAHTVLTGCYLNGSKPSTAFAWSEAKRFLATKLHHPSPHHFQPRPFPLPHAGT